MKSKPVALVTTLALLCSLVVPAVALGHARVSPAVALAGELQLFSLAVPTEKSGVTTSKIVLTVPSRTLSWFEAVTNAS